MDEKKVKQAKVMFAAAMVLVTLAVLLLLVGNVLENKGYTENVKVIIGAALLLLAAAFILVVSSVSGVSYAQMQKKEKGYQAQELTKLPYFTEEELAKKLAADGFTKRDDVYVKKALEVKNLVPCQYFAKFLHAGELRTTLEEADQQLRQEYLKGRRVPLLFVYADELTEADKDYLKEVGVQSCLYEDYQNRRCSYMPVACVLDQATQKGYFFDLRKGTCLYAVGCKMLRDLLDIA